jgi:hypothetical protein
MINKMSFYNVANPSTFGVNLQRASLLYQGGKLTRIPQTQWFTGASYTFTAEQTVAGSILATPGATGTSGNPATYTLPSATDFITLLLGPGGFDVSSSDIFNLRVQNLDSTFALRILANSSGGSGSKLIAAASERIIPIQVSVTVSGGSTTYGYTLL